MRARLSACFAAACLTMGAAVGQTPPPNVNGTPKVAALSFNTDTLNHEGYTGWGTDVADPEPGAQYPKFNWTFTVSAGSITPPSSNLSRPVTKVNRPCEITATVTIEMSPGEFIGPLSATAWAIGGPITISVAGREQPREQRAIVWLHPGTPWQPCILEYFGFPRPDFPNQPKDTQQPNFLTATVDFAQPEGTEYHWVLSGPVDFEGPHGTGTTQVKVYATGPSGRAGASVRVRYRLVKDNEAFWADDTSDGAKSNILPFADPMYRAITCHRPNSVVQVAKVTVLNQQGPFTWSFADMYTMELWSQVGDPFKEIWVQERFPSGGPPTQFDDGTPFSQPFKWNGEEVQPSWWETRHITPPDPMPGYLYSGRFKDYIGMWGYHRAQPRYNQAGSENPTVLTFTHDYYAATKNTTNGQGGIRVGTRQAKIWTDATTHGK